ncbi:hypothetical protein BS47DRAFT_1344581 [Hydnum rufescens UP504]|uniref:Uncharacterized protein n=1 Tax=Hydnum rufescens UP504 TaxID=1448309 RepID=A0A9P6AWH3_9AGAM|nr:hypothetical protein BS47DRAFT_1344581 [Hydnum rufescens UP504]
MLVCLENSRQIENWLKIELSGPDSSVLIFSGALGWCVADIRTLVSKSARNRHFRDHKGNPSWGSPKHKGSRRPYRRRYAISDSFFPPNSRHAHRERASRVFTSFLIALRVTDIRESVGCSIRARCVASGHV